MHTQFDLKRIDHAYRASKNCRIVEGDERERTTYVFFSGNGLYYPNTDDVLESVVLENDHYEWANLFFSSGIRFRRAIFVRDVLKTWYSKGIGPDMPDIDSVIRHLGTIVPQGTETICVGNSAGGYAATLFGIALGARKIFNVSGYAVLDDGICLAPQNPALARARTDPAKSKWFDLGDILASNTSSDIFYFYPVDCPEDAPQSAVFTRHDRVHAFPFLSSEHGRGAPSYLFPRLFVLSRETLIRICGSRKGRAWTSASLVFATAGVLSGLRLVASYRLHAISRKLAKVRSKPVRNPGI